MRSSERSFGGTKRKGLPKGIFKCAALQVGRTVVFSLHPTCTDKAVLAAPLKRSAPFTALHFRAGPGVGKCLSCPDHCALKRHECRAPGMERAVYGASLSGRPGRGKCLSCPDHCALKRHECRAPAAERAVYGASLSGRLGRGKCLSCPDHCALKRHECRAPGTGRAVYGASMFFCRARGKIP